MCRSVTFRWTFGRLQFGKWTVKINGEKWKINRVRLNKDRAIFAAVLRIEA